MEELADFDIESILFNRVRDVFPHHQTISIACDAFFNVVSNSVKEVRSQKHDYAKKIANNASIIANVSSQITEAQNELASVALQQKVLDKQINNAVQQQEKLKEEIEEMISQGESYTLEMVDLNRELDEVKTKRKLKWDSLKRATHAYESALQFHIKLTDHSESYDKIRIIFFKFIDEGNPRYYVDLTRNTESWKVDLVHPPLSIKDEKQLKSVVNLNEQNEVSDITTFLCAVREIFRQHCRG